MAQFSLWIVALLCAVAQTSASILFIDASESQYLQSRSSPTALQVDRETLSSVVAALSGLLPPFNADQSTISSLVAPSPLRKPRALVALSIAGLPQEVVLQVFGQRHMEVVSVAKAQQVQAEALAAVTKANPDAQITTVDQQALQGCKNNCIEEHLSAAAAIFGGEHVSGETPSLMMSSGEKLPLSDLANKLFAIEIASVWGGVQAQLSKQREVQSNGQLEVQDVQIYDIMIMGLHALATAHQEGGVEMLAAQQAVRALVARIVKEVDEAFAGDVVYQVAICDGESKMGDGPESIMQWKQHAQRHLLASVTASNGSSTTTQYPPEDQVAAAKSFTTKACAYGGFVLLLYFSLAAVWCMCNMPMQVDTLLFGSKKTD